MSISHSHIRRARWGLGLLLAGLSLLAGPLRAEPMLPQVRENLANGMQVILLEDHRTPFVVVHVTYHVGALHEEPSARGLAHLFEHIMFHPTLHMQRTTPFRYLFGMGATSYNGSTTFDHTDYYEVLPSVNLENALWLESDRMGFLLDGMRGAVLNDERDIVKNERRQRYEIRPYGEAREKLWHALFPETHPYRGMVIGSLADLDHATFAAAKRFFARWYTPSNATLVLAGDFKAEDTLPLLRKYFGTLPSATRPGAPPVQPVVLARELTIHHAEKVGRTPLLEVAWLTPQYGQPGDAAADLLALALVRGRSGRLREALLGDEALALEASAWQQSLQAQSVFHIAVRAEREESLSAALQRIDAVLADIARVGVTEAELLALKRWQRQGLLRELETLPGRAELLHSVNRFQNAPDALEQYLALHERVTAAELSQLARDTLSVGRRVVLYAVPPPGSARRAP